MSNGQCRNRILACLCGCLLGGATFAADSAPPDDALLEFLGSWSGEDTEGDWLDFLGMLAGEEGPTPAGGTPVPAETDNATP
jgi:hypothetical protein